VLLVFTIATMASLIRSRPASGASLFVTPVVVNQTR
jgi:hypothetical protein